MASKYTPLLISFLIIASCAGGGGKSIPIQPQPEPNPDLSFEELKALYESYFEYQNQWGLGLVNASSAYARGANGDGATIGIIDSGLDINHVEIDENRIDPASILSYSNYKPTTSEMRHGTMVASVAAGILSKENSNPMHGVAFNADLFFIAIRLGEPGETYKPIDLGDENGIGGPDLSESDDFFQILYENFITRNIEIVNNSYGFAGNINLYNETQIRNAFPNLISTVSQQDKNPADRTIFVWSAGNAGAYADQGVDYSSPELFPGMPYLIEELRGHSIAVVSVDENGEISDFSSRCGLAQDFCIAAPGELVIAAYPTSSNDTGIYDSSDACVQNNSCYARVNGTSFAAPFVSGSLAVMFDFFEGQLGSEELVERLFATANKEGIYSNASIYGQGLLDLDAATSPVGSLMVNVSNDLFGEKILLGNSGINFYGNLISDSIQNGLTSKSLIAIDELNSPFRIPIQNIVAFQNNGPTRINSHGFYLDPRVKTYSNNSIYFEYKEDMPISNFHEINDSFTEVFSDLNKSFSLINPFTNFVLVLGKNDPEKFMASQFSHHSSAFENPFLEFTTHGILLSMQKNYKKFNLIGSFSHGNPHKELSSVFYDYKFNTSGFLTINIPKTLSNVQIGFLSEKDSLLGLNPSGALNFSKNSDTFFIGINQIFISNNIEFKFTGFSGLTKKENYKFSLISGVSDVRLNSFAFSTKYYNSFHDYGLEFAYKLPLSIKQGKINFNLPIYRDRYQTLHRENISIPLKNMSRESELNLRLIKENRNITYSLNISRMKNLDNSFIYEDYTNIFLKFNYKIHVN